MDPINSLSPAKCILLAASLASSANIKALRRLVAVRHELLQLELTCRVILTFLPESVEPSIYLPLLAELVTQAFEEQYEDVPVDSRSVQSLSDPEAQTHLRKLHLLPLRHPSTPKDATDDVLTLFLIHRAHRIDSDTGLLPLVPKLITPFLDRSEYLRDWYVGTTVPFLRLEYEYYPAESPSYTLESFEALDGTAGVNALLSKTDQYAAQGEASADTVGRDLRGILGPWVLAGRRLRGKKRKRGSTQGFVQQPELLQADHGAEDLVSGTADDWLAANEWLVSKAVDDFTFAAKAIDGWSGPMDVDLGVSDELSQVYQLDQPEAEMLQKSYCQAALASIYAADQDTPETVDGAHSALVRLAELLGFEPPPELATSVHMLPRIERNSRHLKDALMSFVQREALLRPDNPLTNPMLETFSLLQMLVYSAYLLATLGHSLSVLKVAKLRFWSEDAEQLRFVQRILHGLVNGQRREEHQWQYSRDTILWLWDWALEEQIPEDGYGVFGKIKRSNLEIELLKALCMAGQYALVTRTYLDGNSSLLPLPRDEVEKAIVALALHYYDNASNGNRTRGGVKKAADIIAAFRNQFPESVAFARCSCLFAATHALSFYSLTLRRGIPFQPVSIRVSEDPIDLIEKVLEQNPNSYTKLDDLVEIGRNLVKANFGQGTQLHKVTSYEEGDETSQLLAAERRVTSMAIESALNSDDFETAYSYVVNRMSPSTSTLHTTNHATEPNDDISWRAALRAGRYRSISTTPPKINNSSTSPYVRRLEQRMELLSHALQLAPASNLPEVLAAWRRVEEELLTVLSQESEAEQEFDDQADRGEVRRVLPGSFGQSTDMEGNAGFMVQPRRKELGRGAAEEAPMGLFDVARGAAAAFGRSTSGSVGAAKTLARAGAGESVAEDTEGRQRKRDMVANAVTGGLASGLGWVLGARPVHEEN